MTRKTRTRLFALAASFTLAVASFLAFIVRPLPARPPLPNPNGYDDLIKATEVVQGDVGEFRDLGRDSLADLVSSNAESLRLLRVGLSRPCLMPTDSALTNSNAMLDQLAGMKRLAQLLGAEGRLRELENQPAEAARSYVDTIRLGNEMSRGGFLITRLVGIACEAIGYNALSKLAPRVGGDEARKVIAELESVDASRVTWADVLQGERYYARSQRGKFPNPILWVQSWWQSRAAIEKAKLKHNTVAAHERLLLTELALRCAQSDQGHPPPRLEDLVPSLLPKVPLDPFSGQSLVYRPQGTNWLLYSIGPDGVDDGGRPAGRGISATGDILFDSP